jgi:hypothetical protein
MAAYRNSQSDQEGLQMSDKGRSTLSSEQPTGSKGREWLQSSWDLLLESDDGEISQRYPVCYAHLTVGTAEGQKANDINLTDADMANRQAILKLIEDNLFFNSLNPAYEILLNGSPCSFAQLSADDVLRFGKYTITVCDLPAAVAFLECYTAPHRRQQNMFLVLERKQNIHHYL